MHDTTTTTPTTPTEGARPRRRIATGIALAASALALGAGMSTAPATPAQAAGLTCGQVGVDTDHDRITHSCDGTGTVQYTVHCFLGPDYTFNHTWTSSASRVFSYDCDNTIGQGAFTAEFTLL